MSGPTPGPWTCHVLNSDDTVAVVRAGTLQIAAIGYAPGFAEEANARLIAAAPDLLAALKAVLEELEGREDVRDGEDGMQLPNEAMCILNEHGDQMRAAIARAEGRT